jgi:hypothetical protein
VSDWIPSQVGIRDHPKTRRAARLLGVSRPTLIGHLHCLWWWVLDYAPDGDIDDFEPEDIADGAGWEGDADTFVDALLMSGSKGRAGFLERAGGRLLVHDWEDNQGAQFRARILAAQRKRAQRERDRDTEEGNTSGTESHDDHATVTQDGDNVTPERDTVTEAGDLARAKDRPTDRTDRTGQDKTDRQEEEARDGLLCVDNLSEEEKAALNRLRGVEGYRFDFAKDLAYIRQLVLDFPQVDVPEQIAGWAAWTLDHPLVANSKPHSQLRNRCANAIKFGQTKAPPPYVPPPRAPREPERQVTPEDMKAQAATLRSLAEEAGISLRVVGGAP